MYLCVILSIMTFKFWLIVIKKTIFGAFIEKIKTFFSKNWKSNITFNFSFVSILRHNLQKPYLPSRVSATWCQTQRTFNTSGMFKVKECCFSKACFTNLRTITRFEEVIFLEKREDAYTVRSVDVLTWIYFVLAHNVVRVYIPYFG